MPRKKVLEKYIWKKNVNKVLEALQRIKHDNCAEKD
jgi:hypothetical protein